MANFDVTEAVSYLGRTVLVELVWEEDPEPFWVCVHVVGVVLALEGVYSDPHFLVFRAGQPQRYPDEMFWENIRTFLPLERAARKSSRRPVGR